MSLEQRSELLRFALESPHSDFYRRHLSPAPALPLLDEDAWRRLPLVTREEISAVNFWDRLFVPPSEVTMVRPSSGTSGRSVMLTPRAGPRSFYGRLTDSGVAVTGLLSYVNPHHMQEEFLVTDGSIVPVIGVDPQFPEMCVRIASQLPINAMTVYIFFIQRLAPIMQATGLAERIEVISPYGENISPALRDSIMQWFPNAACVLEYGISDVQGEFARSVVYPGTTEPEIWYTSIPEYFLEILLDDGTTATPEPGAEGELVVTPLIPCARAFPMIRYQTGDMVRVRETLSPGRITFTGLGRVNSDKLKLVNGTLWPDEVARALGKALGATFDGAFAFEATSVVDEGVIRERGIVHLPEKVLGAIVNREEAAHAIEEVLKVTPVFTYADRVREGLYAHLTFAPLDTTLRLEKAKRMYRTDGISPVSPSSSV